MATTVDMSLDDIIKNRRNSERIRGRGRGHRGRGRGRGQGRSFGGGRMNGDGQRGYLGVNTQPSSYTIAKSIRRRRSFPWQTDLFEDSIRAAGIKGIEIGTKLYVSNLDYGVTNEDIRELFSEIGDMKRYAVHYDRTGRPSGSAEVVYTRRSDAFSALKRYNNVLLDGKPMKIEIVGSNSEVPVSARINVSGISGRKKRTVVMPGQRTTAWGSAVPNHGTSNNSRRGGLNNSRGRGRGRGRGSRGRGRGIRGRGRGQPLEKSAEQLNKELESYHAGAMDTN